LAAERSTSGAAALAEEIEREEAAIARLARHADPDEAARLRERLAEFDASDDPESGPLRELMARQLTLLEDMAARLALAQSQREGLLASLRETWRAVEELVRNPSDPEALRRLGSVAETVPPGQPTATPTQATSTQQR